MSPEPGLSLEYCWVKPPTKSKTKIKIDQGPKEIAVFRAYAQHKLDVDSIPVFPDHIISWASPGKALEAQTTTSGLGFSSIAGLNQKYIFLAMHSSTTWWVETPWWVSRPLEHSLGNLPTPKYSYNSRLIIVK